MVRSFTEAEVEPQAWMFVVLDTEIKQPRNLQKQPVKPNKQKGKDIFFLRWFSIQLSELL